MSTVSVIIPTRNRAAVLGEAIECVLAQTYQDWELIVVDDGSTDNTAEVIKQYSAHDARIRSAQQVHRGAAEARNRGIGLARGSLIAFLDDDDRWVKEKLAVQCRFLRDCPDVDWVYSYMWIMGRDGKKAEIRGQVIRSFCELFRGYLVGTPTVMVRRECFDRAGLFNVELMGCEDTEMFLRLAKHCRFACIPKPMTIRTTRAKPSRESGGRVLEALIKVYRMVDLRGQTEVSWVDKFRKVAGLHHRAAHFYRRYGAYRKAAGHLFRALRLYPAIGLYQAPGSPSGLMALRASLRPYALLIECAMRSLKEEAAGS